MGEDEQFEPRETEVVKANGQKGKFFIIDVQAHYSNGIALNFRNSETARNMGFSLKDDVESYSFRTFTKEMFLDSETAMVVISGVPGKEEQRAPDGRVLEGAERTPRGAILPSWLMAKSRNELNADGGLAAGAEPGQPCAEPLLEHDDQLDRQGGDARADGARAQSLQDQFVEVVLPHRPGADGQWLPARR